MDARHFLIAFAALLAAGCAMPDASDSEGGVDMASDFDDASSPASFEEREKAKTDAARVGPDTYEIGCKALRAKLDKTPLPDSMQTRINESDVAKLGGAAHPPIASTGHTPLPEKLAALKKSVVCDLVFDIDEAGVPRQPEARCSDPAFEAHAVSVLAEIRFEPYTLNGKALPVSGVLMPMEFCVND
jgi:hypothetical protein